MKKILLISLGFLVLSIFSLNAANRYWVGGTGTWNDVAHWSATSGGTAGMQIPTSNDDVFFDRNSFSADQQTVALSADAFCHSLDWSAIDDKAVFFAENTKRLTVSGSYALSPLLLNEFKGQTIFASAQTGNTINTAERTIAGNWLFDGSGSWIFSDNVTTENQVSITLTKGNLNTNGKSINCGSFIGTGTENRALDLGQSIITISNTWDFVEISNLNFTGTACELIFTRPNFETFKSANELQYGKLTNRGPMAFTVTIDQLVWNQCFGDCKATFVATVSGATGPFNYTWGCVGCVHNNNPSITDTLKNQCGYGSIQNFNVKNIPTGTFVFDQYSVLTPSELIIPTFFLTEPSCFGGSDGIIKPSIQGGSQPYFSYLWKPNGQTTDSIITFAGTDTLIVTDAKGCTADSSITLTQPTQIITNGSITPTDCNGSCIGTATVAPSGGTPIPGPNPYTYLWAPGGQVTAGITGLCPGTYTCTVTDANSCDVDYIATIPIVAGITATVVQTDVLCSGGSTGSATVTPSGGTGPGTYTYSWNTLPIAQTTQTATNLADGTYICTITDANLCVFPQSVTINTLNITPVATATPSSQTICSGDTAVSALTSTVPGTTFGWTASSSSPGLITGFTTPGTGTIISDQILNTDNSSGTVTYIITPTGPGPSSCVGTPITFVVTINPKPIATAGGTQTICSNGTATVSGATSTNGTILWTENGAGSITAGATTLTPTYTAAVGDVGNTVTLTMTVSNPPCTPAVATYTVIVNGIPTATAGGTQTICANGTATVSGATSSNGTIAWTENGAGSITAGATTLTPTYTAAAGDGGNTVTLTMTVSNPPCTAATATYSVIVKGSPTANAGGTQTICSNGTAVVSGATSSNGTILWTENGAGSITAGATTLTPTYTAAAGDAGTTVTLTMTVSNPPCAPAVATYTVIVNGIPTATAGGTQTICANGTATVSGATSSNGTIAWTENGAGSITAGATTLTPTYTADPGDAGNTVTLTMTVSNAPCTAATATYTIIVKGSPTATAGGTQTICSNGTAVVSGATSSNGTILWTENGAGSITAGATTLTPTYTAAAGDAGTTVILTMTVSNPPCAPAVATYSVIVNGIPTASAGGTQTICSNGTAIVSGATFTNGSIAWTENGAGTITSGSTTLTPTYTAAAGDAGNTVTLTMTVSNAPCAAAIATYTVIVKGAPTATAGGTQTICSNGTAIVSGATSSNGTILWTENGAGSITAGATTLTPTYTAAAGDAGTTVTLTMAVSNPPCPDATATYSVIVNGIPTATAGGSQTICSNGTATVSGATSSNGTIAWIENGAGSITAGSATLTPTYTAAAGDAGNTVTLTMTVSSAPCTAATAIYTVIVNGAPTATAGGTQTICANGTGIVSGATSSNGTILWTENGAGSITAGATTLTPTYTAAAGDAGTTVTLTMTVSNPPCPNANATYTMIVNGIPTATAGGSQTICSNGTAIVSGATSSNGTIAWTENGAGSITAGSTTLTPTYTAAAGDAGNTVTLTMTISNAPCAPATATYSVIVNGSPTATAGGTQTICSNGTAIVSGATSSNGTILWTENGAGSITTGATTLTPTYSAAAGDEGTTVTLTMTVSNPPCPDATATYSVIIDPLPVATAGGSQTICFNGTATVSGAAASNGTISWTENGAGSITAGATTLTPTYTAAAGDAGNTITLTMTVTSNNACGAATATATYSVIVSGILTATAGGTQTICSNGTATVSGATSSNGTILWTEDGAGTITAGATTLTPTYTAAVGDAGTTVTLTMTVSNPPCTAASATYSVIVNGIPTATAGGSQAICANGTAIVSGASSTNGTILWTENGAGSITAGATTLTPTYTAAVGDEGTTVTLTMTVSNTPCPDAIATYSVIVNPIAIASPSSQTICSGNTTSILLTSTVVGTTFAWTVIQTDVSGAFADNGNTIAQTLTNTSTAPQIPGTAVYTITPTANGCPGPPIDVTVTVNPTPVATATPTSETICSGDATSIALSSNVAGVTTFAWTVTQLLVGGASDSSGSNITQTLTATLPPAVGTAVYTITPTANTCPGAAINVTITINPVPVVIATPLTQTICSGGTAASTLSSTLAGTTFSWTASASDPSITGFNLGIGTGDISEVLSNTGVSGTVTYIITPIGPAPSLCPGTPVNFVVTVDPTPAVTATTASDTICSGTATSIVLNSTVPGTTFNWTVLPSNVSGTLPGTLVGDGSTIAQTLTATGITTGSAIYTITPSVGGCTGLPVDDTITVLLPIGAVIDTIQPTCGLTDGAITVTPNSGISPYTFVWLPAPGTFVSGPAVSNATNLGAGLFTVTVSDINSCSTQFNIPLNNSNGIAGETVTKTDITCFGVCNGTGSVIPIGGTSPYSYVWYNSVPAPVPSIDSAASNLCADTYTVKITDANSCIRFSPVNIIQSVGALIGTITAQSNIPCKGDGAVGSVTVVASNGTPGYSYSITGALGTFFPSGTFTNLAAGAYIVIVKDTNACSINVPVTITEPATVVSGAITSQTNILCKGTATGCVTLDGSGGTSPYTYSFGGAFQMVNTFCNLSAGFYIDTVKDANGCMDTVHVTVTEPATGLTASISSQTNVLCKDDSTGTVTISAIGAFPYLFSIFTVSNYIPGNYYPDSTFVNLFAETDTIIVKDGNGCIDTVEITITEPATKVFGAITSQTNVLCKGDTTGCVTVLGSNGTPGYSYSLDGGGSQLSGTFCNLLAGFHTITVKDTNGCTFAVPVTITEPALALAATITTQTNVLCNGGNTGSVTVTATPGTGTPGYYYTLTSTADTNLTGPYGNLTVGSYTVIVTDTNGCTVNVPVTITEPALPLAASISTQTDVLCNGGTTGSVTVAATIGTGTPGYYYTLTSTADTNLSGTFSGLTVGSYTVIVTDTNGCTVNVSVTITEPALPLAASISAQTDVLCNGGNTGSVTVAATIGTGTPGYYYTLTSTADTNLTGTFSGLTVGSYTVIVTDTNGCTVNVQVTITEPDLLAASIITQTDVLCFGGTTGSVTVAATIGTGTPGYYYTLTSTADTNLTGTFSGLTVGSYTVIVTDTNGCTVSVTVTITEPNLLAASIIAQTDVLCNGENTGSVTVAATIGTGTPGYYYTLTSTADTNLTGTFSGLTVGSYTVIVTDTNGCTVNVPVTITEPALALSASIFSQTNISCKGDSTGCVTITASGGTPGYTYSLNSGIFQPDSTFCNLLAGSYILTVKDANGCMDTVHVSITEPALTFTGIIVSQTDPLCNGGNTGSITVTPVNGTPGYFYWLNGIPNPGSTFNSLTAGTGTIIITDTLGCTASVPFTLSEPTAIVANDTIINATCGQNDGLVFVTPTGGTGTYTYLWNVAPPNTNDSLTNLFAGFYSVTITDSVGCVLANYPTPVSNSNGPTASTITSTTVSCYGLYDGAITGITPIGGTPPYTITWLNAPLTLIGLGAGTYFVEIQDSIGCILIDSVVITSPSEILPNATMVLPTCGASNGSIALNPSGCGAYSFLWNDGTTYDTLSNLSAGIDSVQITCLSTGCTQDVEFLLPNSSPLLVTASGTNISCNAACDGTAGIVVTGGTVDSILWSNGAVTPSLNGLCAGTYIVTVTGIDGCKAISAVTITEPAPLVFGLATLSMPLCNGDTNGVITVNPFGGTGLYTYSGDTDSSSSNQANDLGAGTYTVLVTDENGCMATQTNTLVDPPALTFSYTAIDPSCSSIANGSIDITVGGGTPEVTPPSYTYLWTGAGVTNPTLEDISGLLVGTYSITAIDANGCILSDSVVLASAVVVIAKAGNDTSICALTSFTLNAAGSTNAINYNWYQIPLVPAIGSMVSVSVIPPSGITKYYVVVDNNAGCPDTDTITITSIPLAVANAGNDTLLCQAGSITLTAAGSINASSFEWYQIPLPASIGNTVTTTVNPPVGGTTSYYVSVNNGAGCLDNDTVNVILNSLVTAFAGNDTTFCQTAGVPFDLNASGSTNGVNYQWFLMTPSTFLDDSAIVSVDLPVIPTGYYVIVNNNAGCSDKDTVIITAPLAPFAEAGTSTTILFEHSAPLGGNPTGPAGSTYVWNPIPGLDNNTSSNPTANPEVTTTYTVFVTSAEGCTSKDSILVTVLPKIKPPGGITPNGDGVNDVWIIDFIEKFPECNVELYNRWGELLFQSRGYINKWDGTYKGDPLPVGTYYYVIDLNDDLYPKAITGPITIMR